MTLTSITTRSERIDFMSPVHGWSSEDYILEFWHYAQGYVVNEWYRKVHGTNVTVHDLQSAAIETLIRFARDEFESVVERMGAVPTDKRLLWALARRRLNWSLSDYLQRNLRFDPSIEDLEETPSLAWMHAKLAAAQHLSTVHQQLVDVVSTLPQLHQLLLALRYYETKSLPDIGHLVGFEQQTVRKYLRQATDRVLAGALTIVDRAQPIAHPTPVEWNDEHAKVWARCTYTATIDRYLQFVLVNYREDVSYLVDFLDAANGQVIKPSNRKERGRLANHALTDQQVHDIRARLNTGQTYADIAAAVGCSWQTVGRIKRGDGYAYVPEEGLAS
jgi:predicted transcriptional regulator